MAKHVEVFSTREECRARLIEARRAAAAKRVEADQLVAEAFELEAVARREASRFLELTQETKRLLDADVAGLVGKRESAPPPADDGHAEAPAAS